MSEKNALFLGIDAGTTAVKAAAYNASGGIQATSTVENETINPASGWSEQSMKEVWQKTLQAIKLVCDQIDASKVKSVGVCAQGDGLWLLDKNHEPVRNAILWNDQRANDLVGTWISDGTSDQLSRFSRTAIWPGTSGAAFRWLKENEPENAARAQYSINCKDWINFKLTGNLTTDFTDATIPFFDLENHCYSSEAFELLGIPELQDVVQPPLQSTQQNGVLCEKVAMETGLLTGTPVAVGCLDVAAMMSGMGLKNTGDVFMILGTTAVVGVVMEPEPFSEPSAGATLMHPYLEKWIRVLAPLSGASALDWFTSIDPVNFNQNDPAAIAQHLNEMAENSDIGANGVIFLPFLNGERAPFVAPNAKASFLGITGSTTQADLARAVMEGVTFSLRHCFESTGQDKPGEIFLTGGGAKNELWCDIIAQIMGAKVIASKNSDHGLWGAAQIGAAASGLVDIEQSKSRNEPSIIYLPEADKTKLYERSYQSYLRYLEKFSFVS
ncbi:MAG: FGGY-family carbohydrate kinase [Rhizobiaceae bacterium]|nr:FGGY-family carbohydrate kinase [Rhizobiaceae bacterium]